MADISAQDVAALRKATGAGNDGLQSRHSRVIGGRPRRGDGLAAGERSLGKAGKLGEREATEGAVEALVD